MPSTPKKPESEAAKLAMKNASGWKSIKEKEAKKVFTFCDEYRRFLSEVKTEREAHDNLLGLATQHGFRDLADAIAAEKRLQPGDRFYLSSAGKTLILGIVGSEPITSGLRIIGGHTDSPRLDLKPRPLFEDGGMALLDTHYYGGIKKYQWVTIPLALHGVIVKKSGERMTITIGEDPSDPVLVITDLLPHLGKDQAEKKLNEAITGEGLDVLIGSMPEKEGESETAAIKHQVLALLNERYGISEADFTSAELSLVPAGPARDLGLDRSMILGYGQDDRVSAYTCARALIDLKKTPPHTSLCLLCDKEEIGSVGSTGMDTALFENAMAEIVHLCVDGNEDLARRRSLRNSKMLSADVNALHDPNYSDVSSPNNNMARLNHGLVLTKYVGSRGKSGSNDASAEYVAEIRHIFDEAEVTWQTGEIGKVDQGGGGTISHMLARYEIDVIDCGIGLLSMHAPWEVAGKYDIYMAYKGYTAFYRA